MPPEPQPWDRKDFVFKDQKHDRLTAGDALASSALGGARWRETYQSRRDSPRCPPTSYNRQNGSYYQLNNESNGHGCTPSRSDGGFRSSNGRYGGGRGSGREIAGSFRQSPTQSHATSQRSVVDLITSPPSPSPLKKVRNMDSGGDDGQRSDLDRDQDRSLGSIGWKPSMWSRQGSISSSRTVRSEVEEAGNLLTDVLVPKLGEEMPSISLVSSPVPFDDGVPKKKPRLTWGQGLAKYERQKVEGSSNSGKENVSESSQSVMRMAGSMSPVTPCSAACSSQGAEDRPFSKATTTENIINHPNESSALGLKNGSTTTENIINHPNESSALGLQNGSEEFPSNVDQLPTISTLLTDLLQLEDVCFGDSTSTRTNATTKLLLFKDDISKELEKTECEIDLLETELKSLSSNGESDHMQYYLASQADSFSVPSLESTDVSSKVTSNLTPVISSVTAAGELVMPVCPSDEHGSEMKLANTEISQTVFNIGKSTSVGNEEPMPIDLVENVVAQNESEVCNHLCGGSSGASTGLYISPHEKADGNFISKIMASNKDAAKRASGIFDGALPSAQQQFDIWGLDRMLTCRKNDMHVREKLTVLKHQTKYKERVVTLKFKALHRLWKEDIKLLSIRKQRPKSMKRLDVCSRSSQSSSQKHCSIRSRFTWPAGSFALSADIVDFTSRLHSDSRLKFYRKNLKMPALILNEKERRYSRFFTKNNLIEDPPSFEKEKSMINPWGQEEKKVFMEMLATLGKDFAKISSFLSHKTTADCIEFYYKNHKSESFRDVKKQLDQRKQWRCLSTSTYMVTSGKKWNREANAASLDMLGSLSVAVAHNNDTSRNQQKHAARSAVSSFHNLKTSRGSCSSLDRVYSVERFGCDKELLGARALAGVCQALSSEAVSSCGTSSVSPPEKMNCLRMERPLTPEVSQTIEEEDTCSDEGFRGLNSIDWIDEEKSMFIRALSLYGKDFSRISECVGTKSREQCKIFFSKARKCLSLDQIHPVAGNGGTPTSDAYGGRSDTDDACVAEMDSAICSTQSCSRMDVDFMQSVANTGDGVSVHVGDTPLQTETGRSSEQYEMDACNQDEVDGMVDVQESSLNVEELDIEPENAQIKRVEGMDDATLEHTGGVQPHGDAVSAGDKELEKVYDGISASPVDPTTASCVEGEQLKPHTIPEVWPGGGVEAKVAAANVKSEVEFQQVPTVFKADSPGSRGKACPHGSNNVTFSLAVESNAKENNSCMAQKTDVCPGETSFLSTHQHPMPLDLLSCSQKKDQVNKKQDQVYSMPLGVVFPDPSSASPEGSFQVPFRSTLNYDEYMRKLHQGLASKILNQHCLPRINLHQIDQSSHVESGYPLAFRKQKMIHEDPVLCESRPKGNIDSKPYCYSVQDNHNGEGEGPAASNSRPGTFSFQRNEDASESQLRSCSTSACRGTEQSSQRTGDVKLFGQILSNPASQQKPDSPLRETGDCPLSPGQKKPASTKMPFRRKDESSLVFRSRPESIGQSSLEEVPLGRSYGYWDGNRIQTGFSSMPDSTMMLAAYQGLVNGVSTNGPATNFQHLDIPNGTRRLDSLQELQKRSGFEVVPGFQHGGRTAMARLGANNHGILVNGSRVLDPVEALKAEVESWMRELNDR